MQRIRFAGTLATLAVLAAGCGGSGAPALKSAGSPTPAPSVTSTTPTAAPTPTATAVASGPELSGRYKVVVVVTKSNTEKQPAGTKVTRTWTFTPLCAAPTCGATLAREVGWSLSGGGSTTRTFTSTASRTSTGYRGVEHKPQQCPLPSGRVVTGPEQATLTYTIVVTAKPGGRPTFKGTATNTAPAQGGCRAVSQVFSFTGTPA